MGKPFLNLTKQPPPLLLSLLISLFWVLFLWNFWVRGVYAIGLNASIFLTLLFILFNNLDKNKKLFSRRNVVWLLPIFLIFLSFAVYENPFIKIINIFVLPVLLAIFINFSLTPDNHKAYWSLNFLFRLLSKIFTPLAKLVASIQAWGHMLRLPAGPRPVFKKVIFGLALFILLAFMIVIPLLASADPDFAILLDNIFQWLARIISAEIFMKILVFFIFSLFLYAFFLDWQKPLRQVDKSNDNNRTDAIVPGIVIGGILVLYLLFLWIQFGRLWVNVLPVNFKDVEVLVKSGFWQLMFLSFLNIAIFFFTYGRTNSMVQRILKLFTIASLFLLASAGYRMFLYVVFYGFSYEKFFASYAVLYCGLLFFYLIIKMLGSSRLDVIKFSVFLFLWMYGLVNIFPVEQFILRTNVVLAANVNSRLDLYESKILSADVLGYIERYGQEDFMKINRHDDDPVDWPAWIEDRKQILGAKKWYEMNAVNIFYKLNR